MALDAFFFAHCCGCSYNIIFCISGFKVEEIGGPISSTLRQKQKCDEADEIQGIKSQNILFLIHATCLLTK